MKYFVKQPDSTRHWKNAFEREKVICRLVAAWVQFVALLLIWEGGEFSELGFAQQISLFKIFGFVFIFFLIFTVVAVCLDGFQTDTWFLFAAVTICVIYWIWTYSGSGSKMLFVLAVVFAYCLFLTYIIQCNGDMLRMINPNKGTVIVFAVLCGLISGTVIAIITCLRYKTFASSNFDLGLFSNMFYYMKETGLPLSTSERDRLLSHFAVHVSPVFYLLLPLYYIFPNPMTLQIGQAIVVASGVVPVFLLARHFKFQGKTVMLWCFLYSFYPAVSCSCFYDIHENCFLAPLLLWMFYFFEKEKYLFMYLAAFGVLMVKEDAMLYVVVFGVYLCLCRGKYKHGIAFVVGALIYFSIAAHSLEVYGTGLMDGHFNNLIYNEQDSLMGIVKTGLLNPGYLLTQLFSIGDAELNGFFYENSTWGKFVYFLQMFLPLGMLPLCTRKQSRWLLVAPVLMNLLAGNMNLYSINFQYSFSITAFFLYASMQNFSELKAPTRQNLLAFGMAACFCFYIAMVLVRGGVYVSTWEENKETYAQMEDILSTIPKDASLNVSSFLLAHVADRKIVYSVSDHENKPDVDYVVLDARYDVDDVKDAYLKQGYKVYKDYNGLILILEAARGG